MEIKLGKCSRPTVDRPLGFDPVMVRDGSPACSSPAGRGRREQIINQQLGILFNFFFYGQAFFNRRGRSIRQDTPDRPLRHPNITLPWETPARLPPLVPVLGKPPSRACRMLLKGSIRRNNRFLGSAEKGAAAYSSLSGYPYLSYILVSRSIDLFSRDIVTGAVYETF